MFPNSDDTIKLALDIDVPAKTVLQGLDIWLDLELISSLDLHVMVPSQFDDRLTVWIQNTATARLNLLQGLESWLELGLVSHAQVKKLCQKHLVCPTPEFVNSQFATAITANREQSISIPSAASPRQSLQPRPRNAVNRLPLPVPQQVQPPNRLAQMVRSLFAEFSLVWLLFLGVFLVVVSSGVLAASQWNQFPPQGQYAILLAYTLAFGGASVWTSKQENLSLTTRTLEILTLLVVPVNFWAIDGFQLLRLPFGFMEGAIAALILSGLTVFLLKRYAASTILIANCIGLSLLHQGWGIKGLPLIAVYIGTVGTATIFFWQSRNRSSTQSSLAELTVAYATLVLLGRALFFAGVPIAKLGLALGLCGWIAGKLNLRRQSTEPQFPLAEGLLLLGWGVSVGATTPWQAFIVSILALWLLAERFQQDWQMLQLFVLWLVGLQTYWLSYRLLPVAMQASLSTWAMRLFDTDSILPLLGIAILPYLICTVIGADWLRRQQKTSLATNSELLALGFGTLLTCLSFVNPATRSINLVCSFGTLLFVAKRRSSLAQEFIDFTHVVGLSAIASIIHLALPKLQFYDWALVAIAIAIVEWLGCSSASIPPQGQRSAWRLGAALAVISYLLLWQTFSEPNPSFLKNTVWLLVPFTLTLLSYRPSFPDPMQAINLSTTALISIQVLTFPESTSRLLGLGVATLLMLVNTFKLPRLENAGLSVGFGLAFYGAMVYQFTERSPLLEAMERGLLGAAIAVVLLLGCYYGLKRYGQNTELKRVYLQALNGWLIGSSLSVLICLSLITSSSYTFGAPAVLSNFLLPTGLVTAALSYRAITQSPGWASYGAGWGVELFVAEVLSTSNDAVMNLAIANIALGFVTQMGGEWWLARFGRERFPQAGHTLPALYALFACVLRWNQFTEWTGLISLGASLIGIGIGRRNSEWRWLTYASIAGVTIAAYELLLYQMLSSKAGGNAGDGLVLMSLLGVGLAVFYRLCARWLAAYLRWENTELAVVANLHWWGGLGLLIFAAFNFPHQFYGTLGSLAALTLGIYALLCGRNCEDPNIGEFWVYASVVTVAIAAGYLVYLAFPNAVFITTILHPYGAALVSFIAIPMYFAPWSRWGWQLEPWHRSAVVLPILTAIATGVVVASPALWIVAAFYVWLARASRNIRYSYIGVGLIDWILLRFYYAGNLSNLLWYVLPFGISALYFVQVDPGLRGEESREQRHIWRILATAAICGTAVLQSPARLTMAGIALGIGLLFILAGLSLRVRAYLFMGTAAFIAVVFVQVSLLINKYPDLLWAVGISAGIVFIWIAANFESRRDRILAMLRGLSIELEAWE